MTVLIFLLKAYLSFTILIVILYVVRHYYFTLNRVFGRQRIAYNDIWDSDLPSVSVLIPMHNEEKVAKYVLEALIASTYPREKMEVIPINDHSRDKTQEILDEYAKNYSFIKPLHRLGNEPRGKPAGLNDALKIANGEIIIIYDADYIPPKGQLRELAINFIDPEVGAVMGRVVPVNTQANLLTRLLDLERAGGYQIDQQARFNMQLIPQYGGTVGAFRKNLVEKFGGFNPKILAEDTELTFRLYLNGYKVIYANEVKCYEEVPESWKVRARQIRRWSRGHNQVLFKYFIPLWRSRHLCWAQKLDGSLLLFVYAVPTVLFLGILTSFSLFFLGEMQIIANLGFILFMFTFNTFGNFAPFFEIGTACLLDGTKERIRLLPLFYFVFLYNMWYVFLGSYEALIDSLSGRQALWQKTERFRK
ncbi:MAG: glycosyltransferase family 2 protein [Bacteroidia bacterium]|nr:glycosyltransferase family 2 protein [Bacteroidia bacterium]